MSHLQSGEHNVAALQLSPRRGIIRLAHSNVEEEKKPFAGRRVEHDIVGTQKQSNQGSTPINHHHPAEHHHKSTRNENDTVRGKAEFRNEIEKEKEEKRKVKHEIDNAKNDAERSKNEAKNDASRYKKEAAQAKNEVHRGRDGNEEIDGRKRENSGSRSGRSGRDGGVSIITRLDIGEEHGEASRSHQQRNHQSHHHHQHHQMHLTNDRQELRRGGGQIRVHGHQKGGGKGDHGRDVDHYNRLDVDSQSSSVRPSPTSQPGKLFDPRKDDPVRFSASRSKIGTSSSTTLSSLSLSNASLGTSDLRSLTSIEQSTIASSEGREKRRRRRGPSSRTTNESSEKKKSGGEVRNTNSYVVELKRRYREVASLESKLQEEHRSAGERHRRDQAECSNSSRPFSTTNFANKPGYTLQGQLDHQYWMNLVSQHRLLAETHATFMEAALKPGLPASLHSLPQNYNIPTRLWQTGFHSLLERLRHTIPLQLTITTEIFSTVELAASKQIQTEVLDILVEFIYYAYSFYSNLLESETFHTFRSSWIENLGDLARYRMAVAKVMAKEEASGKESAGQASGVEENDGDSSEIVDKEGASHGSNQEKGSIGNGALLDWDLEEKEVWRSTAKDWYAKGLAEMPGTGRLHHHLGILSRDDDLRALHHFCKSLTSSHPYLKARESILPLFERDLQVKRLGPQASLTDLFVHLHGMIFCKVQLDDFDKIMARFEEQLLSIVEKNDNDVDKTMHYGFSLSTWMMMATVNIASLLQYSSEEREQTPVKMTIASSEQMESLSSKVSNTIAEAQDYNEDEEDDEEEEDDNDNSDKEVEADNKGTAKSNTIEETPITLQCAARLTFAILKTLASKISSAEQRSIGKINPYITMLLTFLSQECKQSDLLNFMEPFIPWNQLLRLGNNIPPPLDPIDPRKEVALRVRGHGNPLAEDWCLRGMAWVGRRVYERGFWKSARGGSNGRNALTWHFESEIEVLNRFTASASIHDGSISGGSGGEEDTEGEAEESKKDGQNCSMSVLRWKRLVYTLTVLIKTVPGLDYLPSSGQLTLTSPLKEKVQSWKVEQDLEKQRIHLDALALKQQKQQPKQVEAIISDEDDDEYLDREEEEDLSDESDIIRDLKKRRRELRAQLRESKLSLSRELKPKTEEIISFKKRTSTTKNPIRIYLPILKGYTILMLDTNVMLTPISILEKLVESQEWCTVVPLVAVTELEGLTKRSGIIGQRAQRAIDYLSNNLKSKTSHLKVLTSRGNYLNDLQCRKEEIDFSKIPATGGVDEDDENLHRAAKSIDEVIIHCLEWQSKNFFNRSAILIKDRDEMQKVQNQISKETYKVALITLDKNLRLKARFRDLVALGPNAIVNLLEPVTS